MCSGAAALGQFGRVTQALAWLADAKRRNGRYAKR
jgi:hypothetical protein